MRREKSDIELFCDVYNYDMLTSYPRKVTFVNNKLFQKALIPSSDNLRDGWKKKTRLVYCWRYLLSVHKYPEGITTVLSLLFSKAFCPI